MAGPLVSAPESLPSGQLNPACEALSPDVVSSPWMDSHGKRLLDICGAVALLVCSAPIMLMVCLIVLVTSGTPVFYSQTRLGRNFRPFVVHKIRTMRRDAELSTGPVFAAPNDPRITPVGRVLRSTRLDEVPQLVNVLRGEMSLVGPRPERPVFVRQFMRDVPGYDRRFGAKPGLTGPAQVAESYHATAKQKLVHDLDYRERASLAYDLRVLWQTVAIVLRASGR